MTSISSGGHTYHLSLFGQAIQQSNDEEALRLLTSGCLIPAEENGHGTLQQIIQKCPNPKLLQTVIEKLPAGKINDIDSTGNSALMTAAKCRNIAAINLLVAAKADVNLPHRTFQQTPLHQVMNGIYQPGDPTATILETVQCLLKHGASMEIPNRYSDTALQAYVYTSDYDPKVISLLISEGAEPPHNNDLILSPNYAQLCIAIQKGLKQRKTEVCKALNPYFSVSELLKLIKDYV